MTYNQKEHELNLELLRQFNKPKEAQKVLSAQDLLNELDTSSFYTQTFKCPNCGRDTQSQGKHKIVLLYCGCGYAMKEQSYS